MKKRPKADPVFGIKALKEFGEKAKGKTEPYPILRSPRKRRLRWTEYHRERMRYIYQGPEEE